MRESQLRAKLNKYLTIVVQQGASDLHLSVGEKPVIRLDGNLHRLNEEDMLVAEDLRSLSEMVLTPEQKERLQRNRAVDFSLEIQGGERFRANFYYQRGKMAVALRYIPKVIRTLAELGLPEYLYNFVENNQGLILVTGPTGHGKSTTLAALVEYLNQHKQYHIITIEDPVEYVYRSEVALINQREIHNDAVDFHSALVAAFRQDVDAILLGEMRDLETMSTAITAAETGHLILATLHTNDAVQTIDRIIDVFPAHQQNQIRAQLANVLVGVVSQRLLRKIGGGRVPAVEILIKNIAVENLIRQNQTHQINNVIDTSLNQGMISINRSLARLVARGLVDIKEAEMYATDPKTFQMALETERMNQRK